MLKHAFQTLLVACAVTGTLLAAKDPFVGTWKLNESKSKLTGEQFRVEALGRNKYTFTFGNVSDTLVADGTDQPVHYGRTMSISEQGPNVWKVVTKTDGRILSSDTWRLSQDGKTMNVEMTGKRPDGSTFNSHWEGKRMAGTEGFAGMWESTQVKIGSPYEFEIKPYDGDGLSFYAPTEQETLTMKFDGKDYPDTGPNVPEGSVCSGHRVDERTLEMTDKIKGTVMDTAQFKVSSDLGTLTITVHEKGQSDPLTFLYDRQ
jgi:hypothetical protein